MKKNEKYLIRSNPKRIRYDWTKIQEFYDDNSCSWRDIIREVGITNVGLQKAVKRGGLKTRPQEVTMKKNKRYLLNTRQIRYDWTKIQKFYDNGNSWRDIVREVGITNKAIQKAIKRGDFITRSLSAAGKLAIIKYGPHRPGLAYRTKLSIEQSLHNTGGKCKWFQVSGQMVQGTWERNLALKFDELKIIWTKLHTGKDVWPYVIDGKLKNYTPDFYLPDYDVYLDPKGYWWGDDKRKIEEVKRQHTDKRLIILEKVEYEKMLSGDLSILAL